MRRASQKRIRVLGRVTWRISNFYFYFCQKILLLQRNLTPEIKTYCHPAKITSPATKHHCENRKRPPILKMNSKRDKFVRLTTRFAPPRSSKKPSHWGCVKVSSQTVSQRASLGDWRWQRTLLRVFGAEPRSGGPSRAPCCAARRRKA